MIIGLDHVALNVPNLEEADSSLLSQGYEKKFAVRAMKNSPAKTGLLSAYQKLHDVAYYAKPPALPIEVTHHGTEQGSQADAIEYMGDHAVLYVADIEQEAAFWRSMGFADDGQGLFVFNAMLTQWRCALSFTEKAATRKPLLDDEGYTCIALLVNDMDRDIQRIEAAGAKERTDIFEGEVNGRHLKIVMFRTPGDILVEFIEVKRK